MKNIKLTKNFTSSEMCCKGNNCCGHSFPMDRELMEALQALRDYLGVSIKVTSGFRCITHNNRTKGSAKNSSHTKGLAADIKVRGITPKQLYEIVKKLPCFDKGSFGIYNSFLHVSTDGRDKVWHG